MNDPIRSQTSFWQRVKNWVCHLFHKGASELKTAKIIQEENMRTAAEIKTKNEYLVTISHELRTPLHAIMGFTEVLLTEIDGPINPVQKNSLQRLYKASEHLQGLVNGILELAKMGAHQLDSKIEDCNVIEILKSCLDTIDPLVSQKKIVLEKRIDCSSFVIKARPQHIREIFLNLLSNAVKYTDTGKITVTTENHTHELIVSIEDTGIGIDAKDLPKLFIPFASPSTSKDKEHTGIGLAITKQLLEVYGGTIKISSQKGKGSIFTVRFPLKSSQN